MSGSSKLVAGLVLSVGGAILMFTGAGQEIGLVVGTSGMLLASTARPDREDDEGRS